MRQPGLPGSQFPSDDALVRRIKDLERALQQVSAANILATAGLSAATGGVMVNGYMQFKREDGTLGVQVDPATGTFTAYDATGTAAVARFGALIETNPGSYGVEVDVGGTWVQLGAQSTTWDMVSGKPADFAPLVTSAVGNATEAAHAADSDRADQADGVTPEAYAREIGGIPGAYYQVWMHSNGQLGRNTSDERYKRNIRDWRLTADQLLALRPVIYDRKATGADDYTPPVSVDEPGLLAHETLAAVPELALFFEGQLDSVFYERLPVALLPFVQAHERRQAAQAEEIASLREETAALRQAVRDLGGNI